MKNCFASLLAPYREYRAARANHRLLRFAPGARGYLITYGKNQPSRAQTMKTYLVSQHNLDASRIVTLFGDETMPSSTELYLVFAGGVPPVPKTKPDPQKPDGVTSIKFGDKFYAFEKSTSGRCNYRNLHLPDVYQLAPVEY